MDRFRAAMDAIERPHPADTWGNRICAGFVDCLDWVDAATVVLRLRRGSLELLGFSDDLALWIQDMQFGIGEGPSLDAFTAGVSVVSDVIQGGVRWPVFSRVVAEKGFAGMAALPLRIGPTKFGSVNLYSSQVAPMSARTYIGAQELTALTAEAIAHRIVAPRPEIVPVVDYHEVDVACGMIAAARGIDLDAALRSLRAQALVTGASVRAVAADVVNRRLTANRLIHT